MAQERPAFSLSQVGNPNLIGFAVFSINTIFIGILLGEAIPEESGALFAVFPQFLFFGGVILALAGILTFFLGPAYTLLVLFWLGYSGFFLSAGFLFFMFGNGNIPINPGYLGDTFGAFFLGWTIFTFCIWLGTLRVNTVYFIALGLLTLAFALATAGFWTGTGSADAPLFNTTINASGWVFVAYGTVLFYLFFDSVWTAGGGKPLPAGPAPISLLGIK